MPALRGLARRRVAWLATGDCTTRQHAIIHCILHHPTSIIHHPWIIHHPASIFIATTTTHHPSSVIRTTADRDRRCHLPMRIWG
jgi:hypothetical protein